MLVQAHRHSILPQIGDQVFDQAQRLFREGLRIQIAPQVRSPMSSSLRGSSPITAGNSAAVQVLTQQAVGTDVEVCRGNIQRAAGVRRHDRVQDIGQFITLVIDNVREFHSMFVLIT